MNSTTVKQLVDLNNHFYQQVVKSFDATRHAPWPGWFELLPILTPYTPINLVDLGCGNGRFFKFLHDHNVPINQGFGYDSSHGLLNIAEQYNYSNVSFHQVDLFKNLPNLPIKLPTANLITAFGVWHHIPGRSNRIEMLKKLLSSIHNPGVVIISLWHVSNKKTVLGPTEDLEPGDLFIGWQSQPEAVRYCHRFDEEEIQELMSLPATTVGRFEADGHDSKSNTYIYFMFK